MAWNPAAFNSTVNMSPLLQAIQGYQAGQDRASEFRTQQAVGGKISAGDWGGAQSEAAKGGMDIPILVQLGQKAREDQMRQEQAKALQNPALSAGMPPQFMAALQALPPEQRAQALAEAQNPKTQAALAASRASASHAAGAESRAAAMHPLDLKAKQQALEASKFGTINPDQIPYQRMPDGTIKFLEPPQGMGPSQATIKSEAELRKEYTNQSQVKEYQTVRNAYQNVQNAARDPSAAGDLSMIFSYMKILDPNSVVREQEFANAQNAAGVPDRVRNAYNRIMSGERLNPVQRQDFINQAEKLHATSQRQYEAVRKQFGDLARGAKARPDQIMIDYGVVPEQGAQQGGNQPPVRVNSREEAQRLPRGTRFITPDGREKVVP